MTDITIIAAVSEPDRIIGRNGTLPWKLPSDMKRFKEATLGHAVIMGRKTWDSIPEAFRPLPGRTNIVVTRDINAARGIERVGASAVFSMDDALAFVNPRKAFVIGGAEIYAVALPMADSMLITWVSMKKPDGALTVFPEFEKTEWMLQASDAAFTKHGDTDSHYTKWAAYKRLPRPA